jgi:uncharacterized repeat protein (TIGR01451 family)
LTGLLLLGLTAISAASPPAGNTAWAGEIVDQLPPPTPVEAIPEAALPCPIDPPVPRVAIRVRVPACAAAGEELVYRLVVENTSKAAAHHVVVRNPLPANARLIKAEPQPTVATPELRWSLGTMQPGDRKTILLVLRPTGPGELRNCARVQFEHGQCVCTRVGVGDTRARPELVPEMPKVGQPRLTLAKTGPRNRYLNLPVTYLLTVSNPGNAPARNVTIVDPVPATMTFLRATNGGRLVEGSVRWIIASLDPGASRTVQVVLQAKGPGEVRNQATATAEGGLAARAEAVTDFRGVSALLVDLADTVDPVEVEGETSYVLTIKNQGMLPVTNIQIKALVPPEMAVTGVKGPNEGRLGEKGPNGQSLTFDPLKSLAPGATAKFEILVRAKRAGDARLKVDVTADQLKAGGPVHEEESTAIFTEALPMGLRALGSPRYLCSKQMP